MKTISRYIMTLALLITAVGGAWAQAPTIYFQQDYATETVDWSTATSGRFTPIVEDGYLTVNQNQRQNNGTTLTCTATQGKVDAGKDFTMTFNVKLGASTNQSATAFNIYDAANSAPILSFAEGSVGATAWRINGGTQTATVSAGGGKSLDELSWIFVQVTYIAGENAKTYLTLKDEQNNIIDGFDKTEIPTLSVAGGLGKMTFVTSRYLANFAIDNVLVSEVVNDDPSSSEPDVEVTTNAASEQDLFTEAWFKMPTFDATVNYMLVRDMQDETNPVIFTGLPTTTTAPIIVKKGSDGKYQPAEALTIQLIDPLAAADAQNIIAADGITIKVLVGDDSSLPIEYDHVSPITLEAFLADMKPGYYWIKAESTDENSPYDGTVYSSQFTVVEKYDLTVKPANDFSKGKVESVTVGSGSVTIDANTGEATKTGIDPDTEVKIKAKRGYVIDKVEVKKGIAPPDPVTVTWNNLNFNSNPYTRDGVTLTTTGNAASANNFNNGGDKTFTNTIGKFTKIEIVCESNNFDGWAKEQTGGYQVPEGPYVEVFKLTWTGNAESVTIPGGNYLYGISSITFTIQ